MIWLDDYERRARLVPGLLITAPLIVAASVLGIAEYPVVSLAAGGVTAFGGPVLLAGFVRSRGKAIQNRLFAEWGGAPTTQRLTVGLVEQVDHRRAAVERVTGAPLPARTDCANPVYDVAVGVLRTKTRDPKSFHLVFAENRNFGFERNLLGVKRVGLVSAFASFVATGIFAIWKWREESTVDAETLIGLCLISALLVGWLLVPSTDRAKAAAFDYADRLLEACDAL